MVRLIQNSLVCILLLAILLIGGCSTGPARYRVHGTVTHQGKAIKDGVILSIPEGSTSSAGGGPITNGNYEVPAASGLLEGKYRVSISVPDAKANPKEGEMPGVTVQPKETLPAKYNRETELRAEVTASGSNEFNFNLK